MLLSGHTSTVCQIDGRWRYSVPQCLAPCVVPTISQGVVSPIDTDIDLNATTTYATLGLGSITKVKHGTTLEVFCDEHYEFPISSLAPPTCNNGTWSIIPRCVPARCKVMPKPPKHGMVLAPKTEHGMKARFKCKDGYNLTGPGGKEITDPNDYVLTCSFGNWTGETPMCMEVYCQFPGYIPNGKVLLVGNMGLYDYRPYVKKVINNKQIMYECDKGYVFGEGPPGATCVGGKWSPTELPTCIPGQHPRIRWNRKRRSISYLIPQERRHRRSNLLLRHYRYINRLKRDYFSDYNNQDDLHLDENTISGSDQSHLEVNPKYYIKSKLAQMNLSNLLNTPHSHGNQLYTNTPYTNRYPRDISSDIYSNLKLSNPYYFGRYSRDLRKAESILRESNELQRNLEYLKRFPRDLSEAEKAYTKYYDKIRQKYRNYVKNLLNRNRYHKNNKNSRVHANDRDGVWHNEYENHDSITNPHNDYEKYDEITENENNPSSTNYVQDSYLEQNSDIIPIAIPNINERISHNTNTNVQRSNNINQNRLLNNEYIFSNQYDGEHRNILSENPLNVEKRPNISSIIAQLKSQIVRRRKRDVQGTDLDRRAERKMNRRANHTINDDDGDGEINGRRGKPKEPCEVSYKN